MNGEKQNKNRERKSQRQTHKKKHRKGKRTQKAAEADTLLIAERGINIRQAADE